MTTRAILSLRLPAPSARTVAPTQWREGLRRALLICGVVSSVYYVGVNAYVPTRWDGYSVTSQVVSELSAIGAPTRTLWQTLLVPYTVLVIAFGCGIWMSAGGSQALRTVGALFVADAVVGPFWPPMHMRGAQPTLTDTLHIVWSMAWLAMMLAAMGLAARALGRRFRLYTFATLAVFVVFGTLTGLDSPGLAANLPTPRIGLWERINMGAGFLWIAVLGVALLRAGRFKPAPSSARRT